MAVYRPLTLSSRKAEKPPSRALQILVRLKYRPAGLIYSRKDEISARQFREKLLQIMLCLMGAPGLGTPRRESSWVTELTNPC